MKKQNTTPSPLLTSPIRGGIMLLIAFFLYSLPNGGALLAQNIGISTDGSTPETGVLLDVKGINSKTVTATQNIFQIKSYDASTDALKLRLGLRTNATYSLSYGIIEVPEYVGGVVNAYRHLVLQPSGGWVGIGTTSPVSLLNVVGSAGITSFTGITPSSLHITGALNYGEYSGISFSHNGMSIAAEARIGYKVTGGGSYLQFGTSNNYGSGVTNTAMTIDPNGNICYAAGLAACSDIRYKKDITPLPNSLSNVMKLQGVNYFWKIKEFPEKGFTNGKQLGFIAQEIEKIYPEVVLTDKDGYKSVDYSRLTPVLVEAIKEQQKIIDSQQSTIDNLKAEVANQQTTNDKRIKKLEELFGTKAER